MRRHRYCTLVTFGLAAACSFSLRAAEEPSLAAGAAASVNGQVISEKLVQTFIKNGREALGLDPESDEGKRKLATLRSGIIDELIERALIAQEVERRGIAPNAARLDAAERTMIDYTGGEERYEKFVKQNGFTRKEYREYVLKSGEAGKALMAALSKEIVVTPEEIEKYYAEHRDEAGFQNPERITAAHILFNIQPLVLAERIKFERKIPPGPELDKAVAEETEKRRKLAEEIREQAAAPGADFAALAKKHSDDFGTRNAGGGLGTFSKGTHAIELDNAAFATKAGEVAPVVQTFQGYHIVKVLERHPAGTRSLEEARREIQQHLFGTKQVARLREWLRDARAKAAVVIR